MQQGGSHAATPKLNKANPYIPDPLSWGVVAYDKVFTTSLMIELVFKTTYKFNFVIFCVGIRESILYFKILSSVPGQLMKHVVLSNVWMISAAILFGWECKPEAEIRWTLLVLTNTIPILRIRIGQCKIYRQHNRNSKDGMI